MFATHVVSFMLYCTIVPIAVIAPEVNIPYWALVYVPVAITVSTVFFTRGGWKYTVAFILLENAMSVVKLNAMISGLLELSDAHEWVVTTKLGNWAVTKAKQTGLGKVASAVASVVPANLGVQKRKIYKTECMMALLFGVATYFAVFVNTNWRYAIFLILQGITFLAFGLSCGVDSHRRTCCI